jgi:hypothetical protein
VTLKCLSASASGKLTFLTTFNAALAAGGSVLLPQFKDFDPQHGAFARF